MDITDIEKELKQQIKKKAKAFVILGVVLCSALLVAIIGFIVDRVVAVNSGDTETKTWLNFGIVALMIAFVVVFVKFILLTYLDTKGEDLEKYERIKIVVISVRKWLNLRGYWEFFAVVENITTKEQFTIEGGKDLEESKTYYMLRSKHSKLFAYAPFEFDIPRE